MHALCVPMLIRACPAEVFVRRAGQGGQVVGARRLRAGEGDPAHGDRQDLQAGAAQAVQGLPAAAGTAVGVVVCVHVYLLLQILQDLRGKC